MPLKTVDNVEERSILALGSTEPHFQRLDVLWRCAWDCSSSAMPDPGEFGFDITIKSFSIRLVHNRI